MRGWPSGSRTTSHERTAPRAARREAPGRELGVTRAAAKAIMRRLPVVSIKGCARSTSVGRCSPLPRRADVPEARGAQSTDANARLELSCPFAWSRDTAISPRKRREVTWRGGKSCSGSSRESATAPTHGYGGNPGSGPRYMWRMEMFPCLSTSTSSRTLRIPHCRRTNTRRNLLCPTRTCSTSGFVSSAHPSAVCSATARSRTVSAYFRA